MKQFLVLNFYCDSSTVCWGLSLGWQLTDWHESNQITSKQQLTRSVFKNSSYPLSRGFSLHTAWLLEFTKSFAWLVSVQYQLRDRQATRTTFVNAKIQEQLCLDDKFITKVTPYFLYFQYWNSTVSQRSARDSGKNYEDHFGHSLKLYYKWSKSDLNLLSKSTFFDSLQYWCKFHYSIHLKNEIENGKRWSHPQGKQLNRSLLQLVPYSLNYWINMVKKTLTNYSQANAQTVQDNN